MRWMTALAWTITCVAVVGCAHHPHRAPADSGDPQGDLFPLAFTGQDTEIELDFSEQPALDPAPHKLLANEVCYLVLGDATIECFPNGAFLLLGVDDGVTLIESNPLWQLQASGSATNAAKLMRMYATLFLVCGSIERLPGALSDYLDDPGPRRWTALAICRELLRDDGAELPAVASGGTFTLRFRLTDAGRDKLIDALDAAQEGPEPQLAVLK